MNAEKGPDHPLYHELRELMGVNAEWHVTARQSLHVEVHGIRVHSSGIVRVFMRWLSKQDTLQVAEILGEDGPAELSERIGDILQEHELPDFMGEPLPGTTDDVRWLSMGWGYASVTTQSGVELIWPDYLRFLEEQGQKGGVGFNGAKV